VDLSGILSRVLGNACVGLTGRNQYNGSGPITAMKLALHPILYGCSLEQLAILIPHSMVVLFENKRYTWNQNKKLTPSESANPTVAIV